jgi:glycosyltransferase involved in cell wall biosynthesis
MRVVVLMSTYNGERFIEEQVCSILKQLPPEGLLMVRDDGSTDKTVEKIYAFKDNRILLERGENIGFGKSFLTLLNKAPIDAQMAMFSDQDDVWLDGKIQRAWECLSTSQEQATLYCSRQFITDEKLKVLESSEKMPHQPSFSNAIVENIVTGCTAAINNRAIQLMMRSGVPENVRFHDWWLYVVISAHGSVIFDNKSLILYRQHEYNYMGRGVGWFGRNLKKIQYLRNNSWTDALVGQIGDLQKFYWSSLPVQYRNMIDKYIEGNEREARVRWSFICSSHLWTRSVLRDLVLRYLLIKHRNRILNIVNNIN